MVFHLKPSTLQSIYPRPPPLVLISAGKFTCTKLIEKILQRHPSYLDLINRCYFFTVELITYYFLYVLLLFPPHVILFPSTPRFRFLRHSINIISGKGAIFDLSRVCPISKFHILFLSDHPLWCVRSWTGAIFLQIACI